MDTRFWGPSGWKLLHLITFGYKHSPINAETYHQFFETLPYILPCKFCRASLTDYYKEYPFGNLNIKTNADLNKWLYNIHNCVNGKLRKQGLNPSSDPKYADIKKFYKKWVLCEWQQQLSTFWDFLFSIAYNHPKDTSQKSTPMPNCPSEVYTCKDKCEKNKWNVLNITDRLYWYRRFWAHLPAVLPEEIAIKWKEVERTNPPMLGCRKSIVAWLWRMRCGLDPTFKDPYTFVCKKIAHHSSNCGKEKHAITCRKRRFVRTVKKQLHNRF